MSAGVVSVLRAHSPVVLSHDGGTVEGCACGRWSPSSSDADGWAEHADHVAGELLADLRGALRDDLRALLAGSGEQPGACGHDFNALVDVDEEGHAVWSECEPSLSDRPAPVVPDSPDVYEAIRAFIEEEVGFDGGPGMDDQARRLTDRVLAVVGQGVTAEQAWDEGLRAGEAVERARWQWSAGATARAVNGLTERPERPANPYRAAVRPTGREQS